MRTRFLVLLPALAGIAWVGCMPAPAHVAAVQLSAPPASTTAAETHAPSIGTPCRIVGTGETEEGSDEAPDLAVRDTPSGSPVFTISSRTQVHVTWSNLPAPSFAPGRWAEVELGGQNHLRGRGYADLFGRIFQIADDASIIPDHAWVRGGAHVELLGQDARGVYVGIRTHALPGRHLRGTTSCRNVVYQTQTLTMKDAPDGDSVAMTGTAIHLRTAPGGPVLLDIQSDDQEETSLLQRGQVTGYVHVLGIAGRLGFDGWVRDSEVSTTSEGGSGSLGLRGFGTSGRGSATVRKVKLDAALRVGVAGHTRATQWMMEKGATVYAGNNNQAEEPGMVSVDFVDSWITPPGNESFWIPETSLE